jgi:hypothetical protein
MALVESFWGCFDGLGILLLSFCCSRMLRSNFGSVQFLVLYGLNIVTNFLGWTCAIKRKPYKQLHREWPFFLILLLLSKLFAVSVIAELLKGHLSCKGIEVLSS